MSPPGRCCVLPDLVNPVVTPLGGGGRLLTFATNASLTVDPPYVLRVEVVPPRSAPGRGGLAGVRPRPIRMSAELRDIPVESSVPSGTRPVALLRSAGPVAGLSHTFGVFARGGASNFTVTVIAPDGRTASLTVPVDPPER